MKHDWSLMDGLTTIFSMVGQKKIWGTVSLLPLLHMYIYIPVS